MISQYYSNPCFDRAAESRRYLSGITNEDFLIISVEEKFYFNCADGDPEPALFPLHLFEPFMRDMAFLGRMDGKNLWTLQLNAPDVNNVPLLSSGRELFNIRDLFGVLNKEQAAYLSYALGMHKWHKMSQFCGVCGAPTRSEENGHVRRCTNPVCATPFFPQISPAIIVLIEYKPEGEEPKCLLSKRQTSDGLVCSTFAGFVEVGESLEEAVVREVKEEVSVSVTHLRYVNSQPWPFSSSLMVGFVAEAENIEFQVDGEEIKDAGWFSARQIQELLKRDQITLSRADSIARFLIESWVKDNLNAESP